LGQKVKRKKTVRTRKNTDLDRKAVEFINKFPSAIRKIPPKDIQYLGLSRIIREMGSVILWAHKIFKKSKSPCIASNIHIYISLYYVGRYYRSK